MIKCSWLRVSHCCCYHSTNTTVLLLLLQQIKDNNNNNHRRHQFKSINYLPFKALQALKTWMWVWIVVVSIGLVLNGRMKEWLSFPKRSGRWYNQVTASAKALLTGWLDFAVAVYATISMMSLGIEPLTSHLEVSSLTSKPSGWKCTRKHIIKWVLLFAAQACSEMTILWASLLITAGLWRFDINLQVSHREFHISNQNPITKTCGLSWIMFTLVISETKVAPRLGLVLFFYAGLNTVWLSCCQTDSD